MMGRDKPRGFRRLVMAFAYSWQGLSSAWREESAFRQELALALLVIPAGLYFGRSGLERAVLIAPMFLIVIVELLNSSIEATVDRGGTDPHPLAAMAKDMGSAAVLLSFVLLGAIWCLILMDR
jgi:diacylglycerol kinase (ATP)